jgi:hypothetical protein
VRLSKKGNEDEGDIEVGGGGGGDWTTDRDRKKTQIGDTGGKGDKLRSRKKREDRGRRGSQFCRSVTFFRIRASDFYIQIRILLFSTLNFKKPKKLFFPSFSVYYFLKVPYIYIPFQR